jgi:hypothetical protein
MTSQEAIEILKKQPELRSIFEPWLINLIKYKIGRTNLPALEMPSHPYYRSIISDWLESILDGKNADKYLLGDVPHTQFRGEVIAFLSKKLTPLEKAMLRINKKA